MIKNICVFLTAMLVTLKIIGIADISWFIAISPIIIWAVLTFFLEGLSTMLRAAIEKRKLKGNKNE
jgi:hypothetical protein